MCNVCRVCVCSGCVCVIACKYVYMCVHAPPLRPPSLTPQSDTSKRYQGHSFLPSFVPSFPPSFICLPLFLRSFFFRSTIFLSLMSVLPPSFTIALSFHPFFRSSYLLQRIYGIDDLSPEGRFNSSLPSFLFFLPYIHIPTFSSFLPFLIHDTISVCVFWVCVCVCIHTNTFICAYAPPPPSTPPPSPPRATRQRIKLNS